MKTITAPKYAYTPDVWDKAECINIETFKWVNVDKAPETRVKLFYDDEGFHVKFFVKEKSITAKITEFNGDVCKDSCVEFFVRPASDMRYMNIEVNALGVMHLGIGEGKQGRTPLTPDIKIFKITPSETSVESYNGDEWTMEYTVPFSYFYEVYGKFDIKDGFYGNFYKCGDETPVEHYGMWNEVISETPNFHLSEYFGKINIG